MIDFIIPQAACNFIRENYEILIRTEDIPYEKYTLSYLRVLLGEYKASRYLLRVLSNDGNTTFVFKNDLLIRFIKR